MTGKEGTGSVSPFRKSAKPQGKIQNKISDGFVKSPGGQARKN
jgi:hypothetical protein